ncbi:MAG: GNAT family N-acetyltransferase [Alphaproteobacteria bacterium]|nr:GNAT family N-acetyltransferase [Alphaproteobacteria bacterium]MBU0798720.1 GNAT family N-acetyltransferase [Alphaproteobacteria bacterium]MBU0885983.1 GNAT family N-acetyltransferase [Alphaproteobacteria bacterium]MBU1811972.1 GNAT family N-acetyltransferase [Alphaproteobacteria bacterium]
MTPEIVIRDATPDDVPSIRDIYAHHVLHGLASFEEQAPDLAEMTRRFQALSEAGFPYLAAFLDGVLVGYAYAGQYRPRPAYRHSVEDSIYVREGNAGKGIGRTLLSALLERCTACGFRQMIAIIGDSGNTGSIRLHESLGFERIGTIRSVGFKHGRWVDSVLLQRPLGSGDTTLP